MVRIIFSLLHRHRRRLVPIPAPIGIRHVGNAPGAILPFPQGGKGGEEHEVSEAGEICIHIEIDTSGKSHYYISVKVVRLLPPREEWPPVAACPHLHVMDRASGAGCI